MFTVGQEVFPRWSQYLPAFRVSQVGHVMIKIVDQWGNIETIHQSDLVARDPAASYDRPKYHTF